MSILWEKVLPETTDEALVTAAQRGDVEAFMALCRKYFSTLVAVAQVVLGDSHLAEDAAQLALAKACRSLRDLKSAAKFNPWLLSICRNEARSIARTRRSETTLSAIDVPEAEIDEPLAVDQTRSAIASLTTDAQELIYLRYREGLSHAQIATLKGISTQAVHGRLKRAREAVKEYLLKVAKGKSHEPKIRREST